MFETASPRELLQVVEDDHRQESRLIAHKLSAIAALLAHRTEEVLATDPDLSYAQVNGFQRTTAEVAAAMNLSPRAASFMVSHAETLDTGLPKIAALLAEGRTDWRTVELIITRTELLIDSEIISQIDEALAARIVNWRCWSRRRIINAVDAAVQAADPDAARERRLAAEERDRHISITPLPEGMARLSGSVAAIAAAAFDKRLSEMATAVCGADPRSITQRRADALAALAEGRALACTCEHPDCPNRGSSEQPGATQVVINIVASEDTVCGRSQQPGYLQGFGVLDADQIRELAKGAVLRVLDPTTSLAEALRYQPSATLERWIRCRDLTCRFPGCDRPAEFCDIDHTIPFNHADPARGGLTVPSNLKCLCRQHHRLKTFYYGPCGWRDEQLPDGTIIWTSPTGATYRTSPTGADLFPGLDRPPCAAPTRQRRNHARARAARIARARKHNRVQRPINEEHRRITQARKYEIEGRKFRNHMRDMLFLFKGKPSTSPFCLWINDPREPEELPPDWQPPPKPPPLPDDPPF